MAALRQANNLTGIAFQSRGSESSSSGLARHFCGRWQRWETPSDLPSVSLRSWAKRSQPRRPDQEGESERGHRPQAPGPTGHPQKRTHPRTIVPAFRPKMRPAVGGWASPRTGTKPASPEPVAPFRPSHHSPITCTRLVPERRPGRSGGPQLKASLQLTIKVSKTDNPPQCRRERARPWRCLTTAGACLKMERHGWLRNALANKGYRAADAGGAAASPVVARAQQQVLRAVTFVHPRIGRYLGGRCRRVPQSAWRNRLRGRLRYH
jgi:hypothetical protein